MSADDKLAEAVSGISLVDPTPPKVLDSLTVDAVARLIKSEKVKNVITMVGAGLSTAAGIPDFRSPGSGLYDNMDKYNLPDPMAVFSIDYFDENPAPFFDIGRKLMRLDPKPTKAHYFLKLLHDKRLLLRNYTQNVDGLERQAGLPESMIVEAHGSLTHSTCRSCGAKYDLDAMKKKVLTPDENVPTCDKDDCVGVIKPDIVFFGESLPDRFFQSLKEDFPRCDLLIIMGTSLAVAPFCMLPDQVPPACPRLLINRECVGTSAPDPMMSLLMGGSACSLDFTSPHAYRDVWLEGDCDDGVEKLCQLLGWSSHLKKLVHASK